MIMRGPGLALAAAATVGALAATSVMAQPSQAATPPAAHPHVLVQYDLKAGQQPENVVVTPKGTLDVVLARAAQVQEVTPDGRQRPLAQLPLPADGGAHTPALGFSLATGLVRTADGTLYVGYAAGDDALTGVWRIRPGGRPQRVVALPANSFPNGMALDRRSGRLYVADSTRGIIWRAPITGGNPTPWASGAAYEPDKLLGVNGLKLHNGALWAANTDHGELLRVPIHPEGSAGAAQTKATGLTTLDDFTFVGRSDEVVGALNLANEVALIHPDGSHTIILTGQDGLQGPTSVALSKNKVYVLSAAYALTSPNILVADFDSERHTAHR